MSGFPQSLMLFQNVSSASETSAFAASKSAGGFAALLAARITA